MTTQIGYARVSKADGSQVHDLQHDALVAAGVDPEHIYEDAASGRLDKRPGLDACLKALRRDDTLVIWKLDRLGRDLRHLVNTVGDLTKRGIGLKVLAGEGASRSNQAEPGSPVVQHHRSDPGRSHGMGDFSCFLFPEAVWVPPQRA